MDRDYGKPTVDETSTNDIGVGVGDIGQGVPMGIAAQNIQGIAAKMRSGAGSLEIQFPGATRGQRQAQTPGMYGEEQRQALRELAEINEVNLTTHAGFGIMGLAGMDPRSGNFSKEQKKTAVDEIRRAIDFAADTAEGGSVVVHTGEFQRPISEEPWAFDSQTGKRLFKSYEEEPEEAVVPVVDDRTGQVMTNVRKNQEVPRPVWLINEDGEYVDYEGNVVGIDDRVPEYDSDTGRFKVELKGWKDFEKEARERNEIKAKQKGISVADLKTSHPNEYLEPEEAYLQATLAANEGHARGWALQYGENFERHRKDIKKLQNALDFYKKIEDATPEDEKWRLMKEHGSEISRLAGGIVPPEYKLPSEVIKDTIKSMKKSMEYEHESSVSQEQLAEQSKETQKHIKSVKKYALDQSFDAYADAGLHAFETTRSKKLEKPVFITMENIYPESFGAHPDELKELVLKSRERMAEKLVKQRGYNKAKANELANTHIKATLDTGHLNTWRKYWQNDSKKSVQQNDADFKNWVLKKTEELAKAGVVGNVHLADNYGYQDEHLTPGDGSTPVKEMVEILRKHGYKGALTVEPGAAATTDLSDFHGLMKTWKLFGSPVYGAHGPVSRTDQPRQSWGDIHYSYFGQNKPPYFVFGPYSPSQDWSLWSDVPME